MKKLAIDLDGVTWIMHDLLLQKYNKKYGTNHNPEDYNKWNFLPEDRFKETYLEMVKNMDKYKPTDQFIGAYISLLHQFYNISFLTHGWYKKEQINK